MFLRNFKRCANPYELDAIRCLAAPGLERQTVLKKTKVKSDFLTDINILLMVEKGTRGGMCHST